MARFVMYAVYFLCSGLNNEDGGQSAPLTETLLHSHAPRLIALHGGDRNEEILKTENYREMLMRRASARTLSPCSF